MSDPGQYASQGVRNMMLSPITSCLFVLLHRKNDINIVQAVSRYHITFQPLITYAGYGYMYHKFGIAAQPSWWVLGCRT